MTEALPNERQAKSNPAGPDRRLRVVNLTRGTVLAEFAQMASTSSERKRGLLGRDSLSPGDGLWIVPCESVHTFGMRFAIDLVYLDRKLKIRKLRRNVGPWRISACILANSTLELPVGAVEASDSRVGDELELVQFSVAPRDALIEPGLNVSIESHLPSKFGTPK